MQWISNFALLFLYLLFTSFLHECSTLHVLPPLSTYQSSQMFYVKYSFFACGMILDVDELLFHFQVDSLLLNERMGSIFWRLVQTLRDQAFSRIRRIFNFTFQSNVQAIMRDGRIKLHNFFMCTYVLSVYPISKVFYQTVDSC